MGIKIGVQKIHNGLCMVQYGKQVGDAGRCAGKSAQLHCTCAKVFPTQMQKQTKVASFDDITDIALTYIGSRYKREACMRPREVWFGHSFFWSFHLVPLACSLVSPSGKPQNL